MLVDSDFTEPFSTDSTVSILSFHGWVCGRSFSASELLIITEFGSLAVSQIINGECGNIIDERNEATTEPIESKFEGDETMGGQTGSPEVDDDDSNDEVMSRYEDDNSNRPQLIYLRIHTTRSRITNPIIVMILSNIAQTIT